MDTRKYIEENILLTSFREGSVGGQQVGLPIYTIQGEMKDDGIKISIATNRSQHRTRKLIIDLLEYALTEKR